jgi:hypothetical protein
LTDGTLLASWFPAGVADTEPDTEVQIAIDLAMDETVVPSLAGQHIVSVAEQLIRCGEIVLRHLEEAEA